MTTVVMCPPKYFSVEYSINIHMKPEEWNGWRYQLSAQKEWFDLYKAVMNVASVVLIEPQKGLPDMVFTNNYGLTIDDKFIPSHFYHKERQGEEPHILSFMKFISKNVTPMIMKESVTWEGAGDTIYDKHRNRLWHGYGYRSEMVAGHLLYEQFRKEVIYLELIDPYFYHLDTCFHVLPRGEIVFYPEALLNPRAIWDNITDQHRVITLTEEEARAFSGNMFSHGDTVIMSECSQRLREKLEFERYTVIETPLTMFHKAGGSTTCLTLKV